MTPAERALLVAIGERLLTKVNGTLMRRIEDVKREDRARAPEERMTSETLTEYNKRIRHFSL